MALAVGLLVAYALLIGEPDSYRGEFDPVMERWEPMFSQSNFIYVTVFIAAGYPMGVFGAGVWFLYCRAIEPDGLTLPANPDPIGEIARTGGAFPTR